MSNDLASADDLTGMVGAPFTMDEVDVAVANIRGLLGWHVAPVRVTEFVRDFSCTRWRLLPTQSLTSVDSVESTETDDSLDFWVSTATPNRLVLDEPAPGHGEVRVVMTHGFPECPADLFPVIAEFAQASRDGGQSVRANALTSGPYTIQLDRYQSNADQAHPASSVAILARYAAFDVGFA